jgi:hypothetical protein
VDPVPSRGADGVVAEAIVGRPAAAIFTPGRRSIHGAGLRLGPWTVAAVAAGPPQT